MNRLIAAAPLAGLLLAACQPSEQKVGVMPVRLDCPQVEGQLRRVAQAADGKSCDYRAGETEITLQLTPVAGSAEATLAALEADLRKQRPMAPQPVSNTEVETLTPPEPYDPSAPEPPAPPSPPSAPTMAVGADNERVDIELPGFKVQANEEGAKLRIAGVNIDANDQGAEIRRVAYSRLPGEQLSPQRRGLDAFFLLAGDDAGPEGYTLVGYKAGGRRDGPLVVAVMRSRGRHDVEDGDVFGSDVSALLKRNGG